MSAVTNLLAGLLRTLTIFSSDPALGPRGEAVTKVLSLAALAFERGDAGYEELAKLCAKIDEMVAQGRDPTSEELEDLKARSNAAHAVLQASAPSPTVESEGGEAS